MTHPLETALSAVRKKDHGATLAALLAAFRASRHPRVAALVAQASELAEKGRPAIVGKNLDHKLNAAIALLEAGDPADLPRVLRLLRELRLAQAKTLVEHLAAVKSDPRVLDATLALLRDPPLVSSTAMPLWRALLGVLEAQDDPRTVPALAALDFSWLSEWGAEQFRTACARVGRPKKGKAEAARPEPALGAADEAACAALEEALGHTTDDGTSLLAAIRAAPYDDTARAVWADWLEEQGDPRGRFVALQLATATRAPTDEERKAMRDLLAAHGEAWLSDLVGVVRPEYTRFARGFLAEVGVGGDQLHRLVESEHAATLETLWLHGHDAFDVSLLRRLPALRFVGGIEPAWFADLERHGPFPFPGLGLDLYGALPYGDEPLSTAQHAMLAEAGALRSTFPAVERLAISAFYRDPALLEGLLASPLVAGVRELRLSGSRVKSWLDRRHLLPDSVQELEVSFDFGFHDWTHRFFRDTEGRFSRLVATLRPKRSDFGGGKLEELAEVLDGLPTDLLVEVEVHADGTRVTKGALDPIVEAARRHPGLRKLSLPGRPDALAGATASAKAPQTRAEKAAVAWTAATTAIAGKLAGTRLPDGVRAALAATNWNDAPSLDAARALLPTKADPAWVEAALLLVSVPLHPEPAEGVRTAHDALQRAAIAAYGRARPPQPFTGLRPFVDAVGAYSFDQVLQGDHALVGPDELGSFLDWFETLGVSDANRIYYTVKDILRERRSTAVVADVADRMANHKLNRIHKWAYGVLVKDG
ncbi:MAG: TIGR02996 domain-containing protein [Myxococcales bacterium]|nr:TIGR02996 domain-containing protein [Myxococcales bacterium]